MTIEIEEQSVDEGAVSGHLAVYAKESTPGILDLYYRRPNGDVVALGISLPVSVASGGTGATTAAGARTNLGAAASGSNSDITALSGLTTPLSIAQGGTGAATATAAFNALDPLTTKGDVITHDGTSSVRRAVGTNGQVLTADSAESDGVKWATAASGSAFAPSTQMQLYDDFASGTDDTDEYANYCWRNLGAGTANAFTRLTGVAGHPGIARLVCGTVATGRQAIYLGEAGVHYMVLGSGEIVGEFVMRLTGTVSSFTSAQVGLGDNFTAVTDHTNGVYFEISTLDTNWFLVSRSGGVSTRRDTGIAFSSGAWVRFRFTVNSAATSIQANVNGSDVGAAITTNIPTAAISPFVKTVGIVAGAANSWDADYYYLSQTLTR